ncbi:MAG: glycosyltransferase [Candidatus Altiarchaeota archaeon]|nr:glycosyltransferase [Candidatus Altiarchaeota archaeon]
MKICMVAKHFPPYMGGLEARVFDVAKWLTEHGEHVSVLTSMEKNTLRHQLMEGIEVYRSKNFLTISNAMLTPGIFLHLLRSDYDLVDVNFPDPLNGFFVFLSSLLRGKPYVITYHADIIREGIMYLPLRIFFEPLQYLLLTGAERIIVTSPNYAMQSKTLKPFLSKVEVASSFVDKSKFKEKNIQTFRKKLLKGREKIILFVGRLVPYKGIDVLIHSFSKLKKNSARLVIVGCGPLEDELKDIAADMGVSVFFAGEVSDKDLPKYYCACDVLALPSVTRQEAFGLVLVEAMSFGKPVVTSAFSGMPYVVGDEKLKDFCSFQEGEGGLLVPAGDDVALSEALKKILSDARYAVKIGLRGKRRVERLFTRDAVCGSLWEIYKSAVHRF